MTINKIINLQIHRSFPRQMSILSFLQIVPPVADFPFFRLNNGVTLNDYSRALVPN